MEQQNFTTIFKEYQHMVYNIALHYVLYTADAEDVAQDVFVKIYKQLNNFDAQQASVKTWIYRIAVNTCLDFLKKQKAKKRWAIWVSIYNHKQEIETASNHFHPGVVAEQKEQLQTLLLAIQQLPPNQQTAIILTKIEDKPQKEVAEIMNITVKAVEGLLQRAKQNLEKFIAK